MVLATLLPSRCAACGRPGASPCRPCWETLEPAQPGPLPAGLTSLHAALVYEGAARELVARLKYRNARTTLEWLVTAMAARLERAVRDVSVVTWVPTSERRRRARGFDHAELLARAVATTTGMACEPLLLRLPGPAQTGRHAHERLAAPPRFLPRRAPPRVVLVDDVVTSGATVSAAANALRNGGATSVVGLVAARTPLKRDGRSTDH